MKKTLLSFFVGLMAVVGFGLTSCTGGNADTKVNTLVDVLNSKDFQETTLKSGVFTGVDAKVEDNAVVLTFKTIPGLTFKNATATIIDAQKTAMIAQFKQAVPVDKVFRDGFEGMKEKEMTFRMVFLDINGDTASIDIAPSEVLD